MSYSNRNTRSAIRRIAGRICRLRIAAVGLVWYVHNTHFCRSIVDPRVRGYAVMM